MCGRRGAGVGGDGAAVGRGRAGRGLDPAVLVHVLLVVLILVLYTPVSLQSYNGGIRDVAQCFAAKGNPFISMQCGHSGHLAVQSAQHGRHSENRSECTALPGDCVEDQMQSFYDWQDCMGRGRCFMSVQQSWMPSCGNYSQFLQAEYTCVQGSRLIDVCRAGRYRLQEGFLRSPDYPDHYPHSRDCECSLNPSGTDHLFVSFLDLALEMTESKECADWLLLEAGEGDTRRTDLNCGEVVQNTKNVTVKGPTFRFHFHSDRNDKRSQSFRFNTLRKLKGFWIYFRAEPAANITMTCGPSKPKVLRKLRPSPTRKPSDGGYYLDSAGGASKKMGSTVLTLTLMTLLTFTLARLS